MHCEKCTKTAAVILLVLGLIFLVVDLGYWDFWGISWWTVLFLYFGLGHWAAATCPECQKLHKKMK